MLFLLVLLGAVLFCFPLASVQAQYGKRFPDIDIRIDDAPLRFNPKSITKEIVISPLGSWFSPYPTNWLIRIDNHGVEQHQWSLILDNKNTFREVLQHIEQNPISSGIKHPAILIQTNLLGHGEAQEWQVPQLEAGRYRYLCTIPGHVALGMQGILMVTSRPATVEEVVYQQQSQQQTITYWQRIILITVLGILGVGMLMRYRRSVQ